MNARFDCDSFTLLDSPNDWPALALQQVGAQKNLSCPHTGY